MKNIKNYSLHEQIFQTRYSKIFRAEDTLTGRSVIIKMLNVVEPSPSEIARFKQEYELIKNIAIDGVIEYIDLLEHENTIALVLQDFHGISLKDILSRQTLSLESFLYIAGNVARTLGELHMLNIVHRDIKPGNILISEDLKIVKITDFAISIELTHEMMDTYNPEVIQGTLLYMSPEQTGRMNRSVDYRTDVYSLGVTFYEMLTGTVPFLSNDPMEIIHSHIAREARNPSDIKPDIPEVLSDIIMKMLAKPAEARYQNCFGLVADIERCKALLNTTGSMQRFPLATKDISLKFKLPQLMVGRENEIQQLLAFFDRSSQGEKKIMMIVGNPGIGKSSLIQEIHKPIVAKRGYFISGKYEQFRRDVHYSAIIQAFQGLMHQILSETDEMINVWKENMLKSFGQNGKIITEIIPAVELVVGNQPEVVELGLEESQNRFMLVFKKFISVFCRADHPITFFLDDLQWADFASFKLLREIIADPDLKYLFIIGAYRDNEVGESHHLTDLMKEARENEIEIRTISLGPLTLRNVNHFISNFLRCDESTSSDLAKLIHKKTGGNPFFVNQFLKVLYDRKHITIDPDMGWRWDIGKIEKHEVTANVVELMANNISALNPDTIDILKVCASIGNRFDLETIAVIRNQSIEDTLRSLTGAMSEDLIFRQGDMYRFQHDRIQEAAYSLIPEEEKRHMHYRIGQYLLAATPEENLKAKILFIIDHFNSALSLITGNDEKLKIAQLNLMAGHKAKKSAAYSSAFHYVMTGLKLIVSDPVSPPNVEYVRDAWKNNYELLYNLYFEAIESSYLLRDYKTMDALTTNILAHARPGLDRGQVYKVQVLALSAQGRLKDSVKTAGLSVRELGVRLTLNPGVLSLLKHFISIRLMLIGKNEKKLKSMPNLSDPRVEIILKIFNYSTQSVFLAKPKLVIVWTYHVIKNSLKYGMCLEGEYFIMTYGFVCIHMGFIETGYNYARMALNVMKEKEISKQSASNYFVFNYFVSHWKNHFRTTLPELEESYNMAFDQGDIEFAGLSMQSYCAHMFCAGFPLKEVEEKSEQFLKILKTFKHKPVIKMINLTAQVVFNLKDCNTDPCVFSGPFLVDEPADEKAKKFIADYPLLIMLAFMFEKYDLALERSRFIEKKLVTFIGNYFLPIYYFYTVLSYCSVYPDASKKQKKAMWKRIKQGRKKLKKWAHHAPMNYLHKLLLIDAEIARLKNKTPQAITLYDAAIAGARENLYLQDEAIAYELAGKFFIMKDQEENARSYLTHARNLYRKWGALVKVRHLEKKYEIFLSEKVVTKHNSIDETLTDSSVYSTSSLYNLDISSIIKTSQALSSEIELNNLLKKVMVLAIENAGAQKGFLIIENEEDKKLYLEVQGAVESVVILQSTPVEGSSVIPATIINYVNKTKENIVIHDAMQDERFVKDPYIIKNESKSILCAPIKYKGVMAGIIYLENNLTAYAFTPERLQVLQILSSQAAISIENSRLLAHRENAARLDTEMRIAENIQTSLLPENPRIPGHEVTAYMKPADEVGGDYYDFINTEKNDWLIIGDVSGHGVPAGLVMMMVQTLVQGVLRNTPEISPSGLLAYINKALVYNINQMKLDKYMTITAFSFNTGGAVAFAGLHQNLLIYRSREKKIEVIETNGIWIGLLIQGFDPVWEDQSLNLNKGDVLLLYTDGITEAWKEESKQGSRKMETDMFGEERLHTVLLDNGHQSTEHIKGALLRELEGFVTNDDVTMVVLKRLV